jgi:hypothetical protein
MSEWGADALDEFMTLINRNDLPNDHPVRGLQKRLDDEATDVDDKLTTPIRLTLAIKAFNLWKGKKRTPKGGLVVSDNEDIPDLMERGDLMPELPEVVQGLPEHTPA